MLGIMLEVGLSEHTAQHWLYKLGWRQMRLKRGIYMDRHKREDMKKYRDKVFLPKMKSFERRMVHWEPKDTELERVEPKLKPDKKWVIAVFQDESLFHTNKYKQNIWCAPE